MATENEVSLDHEWEDETVSLAIKVQQGSGNKPGFAWLGGFKSDMAGTKAEAMVDQAKTLGCSSLRFDYSGHGESGGKFTNGTISRWVSESLAVFRAQTSGPQILVGSSMGGWIALRLAHELIDAGEQQRLAALLLTAPAPDFTATLMEPSFSQEQKEALERDGYIEESTEYSDQPNIITKALIEDGRSNGVLDNMQPVGVPVHILQGMQDPDVPYTHALRLVEALPQGDVTMTLVKSGDHRLSREEDIELLKQTMTGLIREN